MKYVMEKLPGHPLANQKGFVLQHRRIWYEHYGEIPANHVIHHKNEDKKDNRIENLECLSKSDHSRVHWPHGICEKTRGITEYLILKCSNCGFHFIRKKWRHEENSKKVSRPEILTCSRKCWATEMNRLRWGALKDKP